MSFRKRTASERFWEILPGLQLWLVLIGSVFLSYYRPVWAAIFIICFDLYWVLKAVNTASHLIAAYRKFKVFVTIDWMDYVHKLSRLPDFLGFLQTRLDGGTASPVEKVWLKQEIARLSARGQKPIADLSGYYHLVLLPFVDETAEILGSSLSSISQTTYLKEKIIIVLASEQRAGPAAQAVAEKMIERFGGQFFKFFITIHPDGLENEIKGKSANATYAMQQMLPKLAELGISVEQVLVSNFDSDTIVHPQYFARVMYEFLTSDKPYRSSYQPIAIYNNNIWDSPAIIRVVSVSNSFFQFTESSRPNRLRTFSSHTMTLKALIEVGYWKKDIVNEDGFIFWQCYLHYKGDYQVIPLFIPISLDTCLADSVWQTLINQYKQKRRWAYNVEYYPRLIPKLLQSQAPFWDKLYKLYQYAEGNFNWATASILIVILGRLPLYLGGNDFNQSVIGYNLPKVTVILLNVALVFLIFSVYVNLVLLPPRPKQYSIWRSVMMYLQWILVPIVSVVFGSLPAVEAQTRLMFGKYLEFWVTPKARKGENTALTMKEMQTVKATINN